MLTLLFKVCRFPEGGLRPVSDTDRGVILSPAEAKIHNVFSFFRLNLHPEETEQPASLQSSIMDHRHITRWSSSQAKTSLRSQPRSAGPHIPWPDRRALRWVCLFALAALPTRHPFINTVTTIAASADGDYMLRLLAQTFALLFSWCWVCQYTDRH